MNTHLLMGLGVLLGVVGIVAFRDVLRAMKARLQPAPVRVRRVQDDGRRSH